MPARRCCCPPSQEIPRLDLSFVSNVLYNSCMICIATPEATQEYLHQCRQRYHAQRDVDSQAPLFDQPMVHSKMLNFHSKLTSLEFHQCTTCLERFPDLTMSASGTECRRCSGDKRVPFCSQQHEPWASSTTITGNGSSLNQNRSLSSHIL